MCEGRDAKEKRPGIAPAAQRSMLYLPASQDNHTIYLLHRTITPQSLKGIMEDPTTKISDAIFAVFVERILFFPMRWNFFARRRKGYYCGHEQK
jgi:hypothetical protein